jgi:predicted 3-demethylubiquinone-9 3-methyltransferase (glyoxalase superfamily)
MATVQTITPCLWFDRQGEEAAAFYVSVFEAAGAGPCGIDSVTRHGEVGYEAEGAEPDTALVVSFRLAGQPLVALNGGPQFTFTEAISLMVHCRDQGEVDFFWDRLGTGGGGTEIVCGWLKDRYGLSWQIVPQALLEMYTSGDAAGAKRAFKAMQQMTKLDLPTLQKAYEGK